MVDKKDVVNLMTKERKPKNGEVYATFQGKTQFIQLGDVDLDDKGKIRDVIQKLNEIIEHQTKSIKILKRAVIELGDTVSQHSITLQNAGLVNMVYDIKTESEELINE